MKIVFTIGADPETLVDDTADPALRGVIEAIGGKALVQTEPLYGAAFNFTAARGNVGGQFVFTSACSYADFGAAADAFRTAYGLLGDTGILELDYGDATLTMANSILRDVTRIEWTGKYLRIRYTFDITTIV